jgi:hypothetical protein
LRAGEPLESRLADFDFFIDPIIFVSI